MGASFGAPAMAGGGQADGPFAGRPCPGSHPVLGADVHAGRGVDRVRRRDALRGQVAARDGEGDRARLVSQVDVPAGMT
jgi:hypothetical protein